MSRMRHAYLVMAHNNFYVLAQQIKMLDSSCADIYLHIDLRAQVSGLARLCRLTRQSRVFLATRIPVYWGHYSQIQCELLLLKQAIKREYDYYHLLSGADLPLKPQRSIQAFFESNQGKQFVDICTSGWDKEHDIYRNRIGFYHTLVRYYRDSSRLKAIAARATELLSVSAQKLLGVNRIGRDESNYRCGSTWFSITHSFAQYVVDHEQWIYDRFRHTVCADEIFLQTLLFQSEYSDSSYGSNMRFIDRGRGNGSSPYTFRTDDYDDLVRSNCLFARKFSESVDVHIVDMLRDHVLGSGEQQGVRP